ncbi:hypothetical protein Poly41_18830 [Novipirellula artificiosorum]|uniref:Uncharacterized protein n=1 Tax=Novipirellula artificiosorum TaxID=2528016 RepID=A0A5C6E120_9BACT|nr:hypothetical protein Poly41_18830 [Novipirellula artificiosorum]
MDMLEAEKENEWTVKVKTAIWDVVGFARSPSGHLSYGFLAKSTTLKFNDDGPLGTRCLK